MTDENTTTTINTRSSQRVKDKSKLVVEGKDLLDFSFREDAETYDISQTGISFYLENRPWVEDSLEITFYLDTKWSPNFSFRGKARGRVVRTGDISDEGKQFIAARFEC